MKNKFKIIFLSTMILSLGACTNIKDKFSPAPTYTAVEKSNFNVQEETQLFAMGSYKVNESGVAVAQMKAKEKAKDTLKNQIFSETTNVLNSFFAEIKTKNINVTKGTIEDLSDLVSSELIKEAVQTNSWSDQGKEYTVLAIEKNRIPEKVKEIFVLHLQGIITDLNNAISKVSNEYIELSKPPVVVEPQKEEVKKDENLEETPKATDENGEPEVYLDDF